MKTVKTKNIATKDRTIRDILRRKNPCQEAINIHGNDSLEHSWNSCERGDWMLWFCSKVNIDRKLLVRAACHCARTSLRFIAKGEYRPAIAINTALAWSIGNASISQVKCAADAAAAAAGYAAADTAAAAAYAAAYAADTAAAAAAAAYAAATAAAAAAYAAAYAAGKNAQIVRDIIHFNEVVRAVEC